MQNRRDWLKWGVGAAATFCVGNDGLSVFNGFANGAEKKSGADSDAQTPKPAEKREFADEYALKMLAKRSRDVDSYTQGLVFEVDSETGKGVLYESGGQYGRSLLRKIDVESGEILQKIKIPSQYFAEGIAVVDDRIFMLTWRERVCLVFDKKTFEKVDEFRYSGEGWGLAFDGERLAMSDGSAKIRVLDPKNFKQKRSFNVFFLDSKGKKRPLQMLNELEFVDGELWANVYLQKYIVRIDPETGRVLKAIDFSNIVPKSLASSGDYVLNGLAFDSAKRRLFVTGKCWPVLYEIEATPQYSTND